MRLTSKTIIEKYKFVTADGSEYSASDILFDDKDFVIEFFVCNFGSPLRTTNVLVSPLLVDRVDLMGKKIFLDMNSKDLKDGPGQDYKLPVSSGMSREYYDNYTFPLNYGFGEHPLGIFHDEDFRQSQAASGKRDGKINNTRSVNETRGYSFVTTDDRKGRILDWIIDTEVWCISTFIAILGGIWDKDHYLLSTGFASDVSCHGRRIALDLTISDVVSQPRFNPIKKINENDEVTYYDYYGRVQDSESLMNEA